MPALSDRELQDQVKATLSIDTFDVASGWPKICATANRSAYGTILRALVRRGYSKQQVDSWDGLQEMQTDIGLWFAIVRGGLSKDYDAKYVQLFDRRGELATVILTIGGIAVMPTVGATASGKLSTADDWFSRADEDLQDWYEVGIGPLVPPPPRY